MSGTKNKMLKFIQSRKHDGEERRKLQKELFAFNKLIEHGFPHRPSSLAFDDQLKLLAIGTQTGSIKIYGAPGVEFHADHDDDCSVIQLFFLPNQGRIVSLLNDNSLHLWEINFKDGGTSCIDLRRSCRLEGGLKKVSACCLPRNAEHLLIGTEGGSIFLLDMKTFELTDHIIYQDVVIRNVPDDYKVNPGAVESIAQHPVDDNRFLIGYNRGLMVLWDNEKLEANQTYVSNQQLECVCWHKNGSQFMSTHNDGSYTVWSTEDSSKAEVPPQTPYGPFPCKAISKILWKTCKEEALTVFSGGMPRASYGDKYTVSVMQGKDSKHQVLDFTSRVVDFLLLSDTGTSDTNNESCEEEGEPHTLLVLAEEELVAVDLTSPGWPVLRPPYLCSLHCSAITTSTHVANVPPAFWDRLGAMGGDTGPAGGDTCATAGNNTTDTYSDRDWPINGGKNLAGEPATKDILLTGHEDGTVRFWDASGPAVRILYKLSTAEIFGEETILQSVGSGEEGEEEWPPFRKIGYFDPYSDDPRLGIQKIQLSPLTGTLVVAGTAGQVLYFQMDTEDRKADIQVCEVNIVSERDSFVWKGHDKLQVSVQQEGQGSGFHPTQVLQLYPPAACTALALYHHWGLIAAGTAHGFCVYDFLQKKSVLAKCSLNTADMSGTSDTPMSRRKSLKKSLRESFRRIRKMRERRGDKKRQQQAESSEASALATAAKPSTSAEGAGAAAPTPATTSTPAAAGTSAAGTGAAGEGAGAGAGAAAGKESGGGSERGTERKHSGGSSTGSGTGGGRRRSPHASPSPAGGAGHEKELRPVERQIEARSTSQQDDGMGSMVRCLYFGRTFIIAGQSHVPTVWAGTNGGQVYIYTLDVAEEKEKRMEEPVQAHPGKELQLRHGAPVVFITVIDSTNRPLPDPTEVQHERERPADMNNTHRVIVCSEEQFKVFHLPSLKPYCKYKLTAHEGSQVRKLAVCKFRKRDDTTYSEYCLSCLSNQGEVTVHSIPQLKPQLRQDTTDSPHTQHHSLPSLHHTHKPHATNYTITKREDIVGISSCVFTQYGEGYYLISPSEMCRFSLSAKPTVSIRCQLELPDGARPEPAAEPEPEPKPEPQPDAEQPAAIPAATATAAEDKEKEKETKTEEKKEKEEEKKEEEADKKQAETKEEKDADKAKEPTVEKEEKKEEAAEAKDKPVVAQTSDDDKPKLAPSAEAEADAVPLVNGDSHLECDGDGGDGGEEGAVVESSERRVVTVTVTKSSDDADSSAVNGTDGADDTIDSVTDHTTTTTTTTTTKVTKRVVEEVVKCQEDGDINTNAAADATVTAE